MMRPALVTILLVQVACSESGAGHGGGATGGTGAGGEPAATGGALATGGAFATGGALSAPEDFPYDPEHASLYQPIPADAVLDPNSAAIAAAVADNFSGTRRLSTGNGMESPPVYVAAPTDPVCDVVLDGALFTTFRAPAGITSGGGSDFPIEILDRNPPAGVADGNPYVELRMWQAVVSGTTINVSNASLHHYNNDGAILNPNGTESAGYPFDRNATGSGLSYLWGMIRPADVRAGAIRHAIRVAYPCPSAHPGGFVPPALYSDQPNGCTKTAPLDSDLRMGQRIQLDPAVDCSGRTAPGKAADSLESRFVRMFCVAMQEYGLIMLDGSSDSAPLVYMEGDATADWPSLVGEMMYGHYGWMLRTPDYTVDGIARNGTTDGIPWTRVRIPAQGCWADRVADDAGATCG